LKKVGEWKN
jgi:hypothetical protein